MARKLEYGLFYQRDGQPHAWVSMPVADFVKYIASKLAESVSEVEIVAHIAAFLDREARVK